MTHLHERLRYRLLTGRADADFCAQVSRLLDEGYELYGSPAITHDGERAVVAQAVVLPPYEAVRFRGPVPPMHRPEIPTDSGESPESGPSQTSRPEPRG